MIPILTTILLSSFKFAMTFPLAVFQFRFGFAETLLWTNLGGLLGIYFFAYLAGKLIAWWNRTFRKRRLDRAALRDGKRVFTARNRRIVRIKQRYGMIGIAITTPVLLSIPVGAFLMVRYYPHRRIKFTWLIIANAMWSMIYTVFCLFWDGILFHRG